jgi:hypothetical protein
MASLKKRLKKVVRTTHKYVGRVVSVAAPIAGAVFAGPLGAAAGTAVGTSARYYGEKQGALASGKHGKDVKKAGKRGLKAGLIIGGIVTGGAAVAAIAGGTGAAGALIPGLLGNVVKKPVANAPAGFVDTGANAYNPLTGAPVSDAQIAAAQSSGGASGPGVSGIITSLAAAGLSQTANYGEHKGKKKSGAGILDGLTGDGGFLDFKNDEGKVDYVKLALIGAGAFVIVTALSKGHRAA